MNEKYWSIYVLFFEETGERFYVGKTPNVEERLTCHRSGKSNSFVYYYPKHAWILDEHKINMFVLEANVNVVDSVVREQFWYDQHKIDGWVLINSRPRGSKPCGTRETALRGAETKRKNGTPFGTPESVAIGIATKRKNGTLGGGTRNGALKAWETKKLNGKIGGQYAGRGSSQGVAKRNKTVAAIKHISKTFDITYSVAKAIYYEQREH